MYIIAGRGKENHVYSSTYKSWTFYDLHGVDCFPSGNNKQVHYQIFIVKGAKTWPTVEFF